MKACKTVGILIGLSLPLISGDAQPQPSAEAEVVARSATTNSPALVAPANLSANASEVVRLAESGVGEEVLLAYVRNSQSSFGLSSQDILYLKDVGLNASLVTAMLNRDTELRAGAPAGGTPTYDQKLYASSSPQPASPQVAPVQVAPAPEAQTPVAPPPASSAVVSPPASTPPPVYVSNAPADVTYFYNDLAPYGTWIELDGVGWCWQPRVVVINRAWRPYCDSGYWMYSDAGWYWQSSYSWGWAPFHYGRWQLHPRCGWVWMPDRVWGPAWVTWRSGGDHCGWAPLPPRATFDVRLGYCYNGVQVGVGFDFGLHSDAFTFIAVSNFGRHDYGHYRLPPAQVNNIYNHTTVINNYTVNNNIVVNRGLPVDRVSAATHTSFERAIIRDAPPGRVGGQVAQNPGKGVIYRPQLAAPTKPGNVVAQRVDARNPVIQHTSLVQPSTIQRPTRLGAPANVTATPTAPRPAGQGTVTRPASQATVNPGKSGGAPVTTTPSTTTSTQRPSPTGTRNPQQVNPYSGSTPHTTTTTTTTPAPRNPATVQVPRSSTNPGHPTSTASQGGQSSAQSQPKSYYYQSPRSRTPIARPAPSDSNSRDSRASQEPRNGH